ncbi:MAG: FAD-binding oxidoreductase [Holophaga sp.]|nr:FAD-binding oxidoreductase [Holophaga sp.]
MPSDLSSLAEQLETIVGRDQVLAGPSCTAPFAVDGVSPELVVRPDTEEEVSQVVAACSRTGAAIIPWGEGTAMGLGNPPARTQVVLQLGRMNRMVAWDPANLTVTAEAGMRLATLQETVARDRAILPLDPPADHLVTLGGLVAANQNGPSRLRYGTVRDWLLGMRVVLPDGERIHCGGRVIKNVSGYDMNKMFIRSLGTLGIITEVTFKLLPMPAQWAGVIGLFPHLAGARSAVTQAMASFLLPESIDLLNPEAVELLAPTLELAPPARTWGLAVALAGSPETVARQAHEFSALVEANGGSLVPVPATKVGPTWHAVRNLLEAAQPANPARILCKITVPIARTCDLVAAAGEQGRIGGLRSAIMAYAGSGVIWLLYLPDAGTQPQAPVSAALEALRAQAVAAGGGLVLHHAPPPLKRLLDVWGPAGSGLELMRRLKAEFDPRGICNPGRFVAGI